MVDKSLREIIQRNVVPQIQSVRTPHKYFVLNSLTLSNSREVFIRLGTRNVYTDFPRIAWIICNELHRYCNVLASQMFSEEDILQLKSITERECLKILRERLNRIVQHIKNEKKTDHPLNTVYQYTTYLEKLGITWSIHFRGWDEKPFIKLNANRYYKQIWPKKILTFISCLESGNDNPMSIYKMAGDMSVEYPLGDTTAVQPNIFRLLSENGISIIMEVEKLKKLVTKLANIFSIVNETTVYDLFLQPEISAILNDMHETLNEIRILEYGGHFLSGYFALRHLLIDLGNVLLIDFLSSLSKEVLPPLYPDDFEKRREIIEHNFEQSIWELEEYLDNFNSRWIQSLAVDNVGIPHLKIFNGCTMPELEYKEISRLEHLANRYKNGGIREDIQNLRRIKLRDSALVDLIDWVINSQRVFSDVITDVQLLSKLSSNNSPNLSSNEKKKSKFILNASLAKNEYGKLNEAVHRPILVDFPPYGSTIEYLGFVHHLRIVRNIFEKIVRIYGRKSKTKAHSI